MNSNNGSDLYNYDGPNALDHVSANYANYLNSRLIGKLNLTHYASATPSEFVVNNAKINASLTGFEKEKSDFVKNAYTMNKERGRAAITLAFVDDVLITQALKPMDDTPQIKNAYQQYLAYANELPVSKIKTELEVLKNKLIDPQKKLKTYDDKIKTKYGLKGRNTKSFISEPEEIAELRKLEVSINKGISKIEKTLHNYIKTARK